jgi:ArsR family transcriptional regulator, arsenate/arsenite/antimonite-responsive transcriptional repressor
VDPQLPPTCCRDELAPLQVLARPLAESEAVELAAVLKTLADPIRLRLLSMIAGSPGGEACACDFSGALGRSQPTVSHHLSQLVSVGILEREQRGRWAWFRVDGDRLDVIHRALGRPDCC